MILPRDIINGPLAQFIRTDDLKKMKNIIDIPVLEHERFGRQLIDEMTKLSYWVEIWKYKLECKSYEFKRRAEGLPYFGGTGIDYDELSMEELIKEGERIIGIKVSGIFYDVPVMLEGGEMALVHEHDYGHRCPLTFERFLGILNKVEPEREKDDEGYLEYYVHNRVIRDYINEAEYLLRQAHLELKKEIWEYANSIYYEDTPLEKFLDTYDCELAGWNPNEYFESEDV